MVHSKNIFLFNSVIKKHTYSKRSHEAGCDTFEQLSEVNGYKHLIVLVDYFSKWVEAKPLSDKNAKSVALFLYKQVYKDGCFEMQINDQNRKFVNELPKKTSQKTGICQRMASS